MHTCRRFSLSFLASSFILATIGCGFSSIKPAETSPATGEGISGTVHGGQQAISGATVTLYAPATTGYGNAPTAIVSTSSTPNGSFTLPRPYTCPTNSGNVYIEATGGTAGSGTNTAIALVALLGPCSALSSGTTVILNEATTVAAAYALAPFATVSASGTGIGTSATNLTGLNNAYGPATNLVNTTTGNPNAANAISGMILPTAELDTIANILADCVNTASSSTCTTLFTAATPPGGTAPSDTFQAALDIALNPANNLSSLYPLASAFAVFQPALTGQPADFALGIQYNGSVISACAFTTGVAIDQIGNAWVGCGTGNSNAGVTEISPSGTYLSAGSGFSLPLPNGTPRTGGNGIAIDSNGAAWLTNASESAVYQISSSGSASRFAPAGDLNGPTGIAINNGTNQVYVANTGNNPAANNGSPDYLGQSIAVLNLSGAEASGPYSTPAVYGPTDLANANGNYVIADFTGYSTASTSIAAIETIAPGSSPTINAQASSSPTGALAADAASNIWYVNTGIINEFVAIDISGTYYYTPGGTTVTPSISPLSLMFDGNDHLLIAGTNSSSQGRLAFYDDSMNLLYTVSANNTIPPVPYDPTGLDIDSSGNIWITGTSSSNAGYVTELIGAAGPVPMPKAAAGLLNKVAARP